ncbi:DUF4224 domain-containing protein [Agitococcus lubricus]|uniref:Uncharacterized protein DUF4224 n=1 Tax=Agitococcus lubricus TaxID=1077255 RepID=A0A2T5J0L8_9GAMM|nr:DUF4224 domain-containing protein [Agitococcus lubricus]PTQ89826.1 uncharacterized protein DUF4224 [Agitococcus lubricus]
MNSTFLTFEEVQELTDYSRPKEQIQWLSQHGWTFEISSQGKPKILRQYMQQRLGIAQDKKTVSNKPNRKALEALINGT